MKATAVLPSAHLYSQMDAVSKRSKLLLQRLLSRIDRWGLQLPVAILRAIVAFGTAQELALSQCVCGGSRLSKTLLDRSWEELYRREWETDGTEAHTAIAVAGPSTPWSVRYRRRQQTERN